MRASLFAAWLCAMMPLTATAQDIPGSDAPAFVTATEAWLGGEDDLAALQAFSTLANANNRAAQIFLGRIGQTPHLTTHITEGMARADRIALLRSPGGLSGRSWMEAAAVDVPLAQAFIDNAVQADRITSIRTLFRAEEIAFATRSLPGLLAHGPVDSLAALEDLDVMPDEARIYMISNFSIQTFWASGQRIQTPDPLRDGSQPELALVWLPISPAQWRDDSARRAVALDASPRIESLAPIHALCQRACPDEVLNCTATGASLIAQTNGPFPFASPTESLIPTATYWGSPRFDADVMRLLNAFADPDQQTAYVEMNACFMEAASN